MSLSLRVFSQTHALIFEGQKYTLVLIFPSKGFSYHISQVLWRKRAWVSRKSSPNWKISYSGIVEKFLNKKKTKAKEALVEP